MKRINFTHWIFIFCFLWGSNLFAHIQGNLAMALYNKDIKAAKEILSVPENVSQLDFVHPNFTAPNEETLLSLAIKTGNLEVVELILDASQKIPCDQQHAKDR